ncbi:Wzz/FepE/Etk N-terminal domain-containing protein [Cetobacterium sp.]|uniref:Wzz/FepE/Etk N-terminal domain-containing protein n=1 Tax=Cetobacterium sp. TaxID=2071632 RepID=UPI003F345316
MGHEVSTDLRQYDDEIDLRELILILVKEKKTIFLTTVLVTLLALGGALLERDSSKKASAIITSDFKSKTLKQEDLLIGNVLEKVYSENQIRKKNELTLDEFSQEFMITGVIPSAIESKREFLSKSGEVLEFTPTSYKVQLRVGSIDESKEILKDYLRELNGYYREKNESNYRFKKYDTTILKNKIYNYEDYLSILEERKASLKELLKGRELTKLDYVSYGFKYREIAIDLENLETIAIVELKNYLLATNIVRDKDKFKSEFLNRKNVLENEISEKKSEAQNYKNILDSYKLDNNKVIVPRGVKIAVGENKKEQYYTELMASYLKAEKEVLALDEKLKELESINTNLKNPTVEEERYIVNLLEGIIGRYNEIVDTANSLEIKENAIQNGSLIKVAAPVQTESHSKAKLILAVGIVMGMFMGVMMAFVKTFYTSFKDYSKKMMILGVFLLGGLNSYSKSEINLNFTHKEMKSGLNPDKTPFDLEEILVQKYLLKTQNLSEDESKNVVISPILQKDSLKDVETKIKSGTNYLYIPSEYKVVIDLKDANKEKEVVEKIKSDFSIYYLNYFIDTESMNVQKDYLKDYKGYREKLDVLNNLMKGLESEISLRKQKSLIKDVSYEYNNLNIELNKIRNIKYRDLTNYINSNHFVLDTELEKTYISGDNRYIELELQSLKNKEKIYSKILKNYSSEDNSAQVLESGDISMKSDSGLREKQYIETSKEYLEDLNKKNILEIKLQENIKYSKNMKNPTKVEADKIVKDINDIEKEINDIYKKMTIVELRDYRREYLGSVKVF